MSWESSPSIQSLSQALVAALGELTEVRRDKQAKIETRGGTSFGYKYADLATALGAIRPVLARHGLGILQATHTDQHDSVLISTTILHASGEWMRLAPLAMPVGRTAQETGSAITYGRRYALLAALGLATEDDDGASASQRGRGQQRSAREADSRPAPRDPAPSPTTGTEARTDEEAEIRRIISSLPSQQGATVRANFRANFGALVDLPEEKHGEALNWIRAEIGGEG